MVAYNTLNLACCFLLRAFKAAGLRPEIDSEAIDVMRFDEAGKIASIQVYWGLENFSEV